MNTAFGPLNPFLILALSLFLATSSALADDLKAFKSDGCSSFPNGTISQQNLWLNCCIIHDKAYWKGGTFQQRLEADIALKDCVEQVGEPQIAELMLQGVRVGGTPYLPTKFRWGYGWSYPRDYRALSEEELLLVKKREKESLSQ